MKTPEVSKDKVAALAAEAWKKSGRAGELPAYYMFAVRGYWPVSMGPTSKNDPGVYDDAWFFVGPDVFLALQANTDPSRYGWNAGAGKPMAVLQPGFWPFYRGAHKKRVPALRQYTEDEAKAAGLSCKGRFTVMRTYGTGDSRNYTESGYYAINAHRGGNVGTSSEGCQTAPPETFDSFMSKVWSYTKNAGLKTVWYGLIDGPIN